MSETTDELKPNNKLRFSAKYNPNEDRVEMQQDIMGNITRQFIDLKDEATRKALIDAGWLPPNTRTSITVEEFEEERNKLKGAISILAEVHSKEGDVRAVIMDASLKDYHGFLPPEDYANAWLTLFDYLDGQAVIEKLKGD